jgi:hypothetical protein
VPVKVLAEAYYHCGCRIQELEGGGLFIAVPCDAHFAYLSDLMRMLGDHIRLTQTQLSYRKWV